MRSPGAVQVALLSGYREAAIRKAREFLEVRLLLLSSANASDLRGALFSLECDATFTISHSSSDFQYEFHNHNVPDSHLPPMSALANAFDELHGDNEALLAWFISPHLKESAQLPSTEATLVTGLATLKLEESAQPPPDEVILAADLATLNLAVGPTEVLVRQ